MGNRNRQGNSPSVGMRIGRIVLVLVVLGVAAYFGAPIAGSGGGSGTGNTTPADAPAGAAPRRDAGGVATLDPAQTQARVARLMKEQQSGEMVAFDARVVKRLPDDNDGSRHQRFLLAIDAEGAPYSTVLVAHNIDLAERVPLEEGDVVSVYGQYEFNDRGGVLHWTHHDPKGWREGGWIEHEGVRYE